MKYQPQYQFIDKMHVESIAMDQESEVLTLLVRLETKNGISSVKHVFCTSDQLGQLFTEDGKDIDEVLNYIVFLIETDRMRSPEEIDLEALIGHPLSLSKYRLRMYNPMVQNADDEPMQIDLNLFELDLILPKH
ncbi:MAG: hypothetical protein H6602_01360 [Flavobacteriales bacterium]|nr:hypothetical protein [Flavobacteriales bacterium]